MGSCVTGVGNVAEGPEAERYSRLRVEGIIQRREIPWSNTDNSSPTLGAKRLPPGISIVGYDPEFDFIQEDHNLSSVMPLFLKERVLGKGASSEVAMVVRKSDKKEFAMKTMRRDDKWNPILFKQEYKLLSMLDHPNILRYRDCYMDEKNFYMCTELCKGGELFDKLKVLKKFNEVEAAAIIETIVSAISHCHSKNIVHRDLKPENILFRSKAGEDLIIIDFGDAKIIKEEETYEDFVGTAFYLSPECVRARKGWELKKTDMWTIGVIAYIMLTGRPPFYGRDNRSILRKIMNAKVSWKSKSGKYKVSSCAKNFIEQLLKKETKERPTAEQALDHKWLTGDAGKEDLGTELRSSLHNYSVANKLKKMLVRVLANEMTQDDQLVLKKQFDLMDTDGNGEIDMNDLTEFIFKMGGTRLEAEEKASAIFDKVDQKGDGVLRVEEWTNAQIAAKFSYNDSLVREQFERIDVENDGFITTKKLDDFVTHEKIGKLFNCSMTKEGITNMIKEIDRNNDGKISYQEFVQAMKDGSMSRALTTRTAFIKEMGYELALKVKESKTECS